MTINLPTGHPGRYFAVLDDQGGPATFWRLDRRGRLVAWPSGTRNGPTLWKEPGPGREHVIPAGLDGEARSQWMSNWVATVSGPWHDRIRAIINADPDAAAARCAGFTSSARLLGNAEVILVLEASVETVTSSPAAPWTNPAPLGGSARAAARRSRIALADIARPLKPGVPSDEYHY